MALVLIPLLLAAVAPQPSSPLGGVWTLNRSASDMPKEIGFNLDWVQAPSGSGSGDTASGGGGGRRGGGRGGGGGRSSGAFPAPRESYEDARRVQFLTGEARNPATRLMIVDTPAAVTLTNELGQSRTLHPTGREESIEVAGVPLLASTRHDGDKLVVTYIVDKDRQVRYTYAAGTNPGQLTADVQFIQHGAGDKGRLVYEAATGTENRVAPSNAPASAGSAPPSAGQPPAQPAAPTVPGADTRPGAELQGLKAIGILVEDLGPQAIACGLNHDAIESSLARRLSDAGFSVRRNSDEDTYLYVNIQTSTIAGGTCVTRYDAFLYTHATATLSYREHPALVQVSLIHRGGIGTSAAAGHGPAVQRALEGYVDLMVTQIRDANK